MLDLAINTTSSKKKLAQRTSGDPLWPISQLAPGKEFPRIFAFKNWSGELRRGRDEPFVEAYDSRTSRKWIDQQSSESWFLRSKETSKFLLTFPPGFEPCTWIPGGIEILFFRCASIWLPSIPTVVSEPLVQAKFGLNTFLMLICMWCMSTFQFLNYSWSIKIDKLILD